MTGFRHKWRYSDGFMFDVDCLVSDRTEYELIINTPVLRIDNQQNFKIMKISILFKSFISLIYIIRYIL